MQEAMLRSRRSWLKWYLVAALILVLLYLHSDVTFAPETSPSPSLASHTDISYLRTLLKDNGIGSDIEFVSRRIQYKPVAEKRLSITESTDQLFPDAPIQINLEEATSLPPLASPVTVAVEKSPRPKDVDASSLIFGVSTIFSRFDDAAGPMKEWIRWLTDGNGRSNGATLVVCLYQATEEQFAQARERLAAAGIDATVQASDESLDMPGRYLSLVAALYGHPTASSRKYFGLIDDDTFFPSISALMSTFSEYDPTKPYYIGAFTERVDWMMDHRVPMAYGGGGVFLTARVVKALVDLLPTCLKRDEQSGQYLEWGQQGDLILYNCLHNHTEITLTNVPQLHQMDQFGDPSGLYESGQMLLSLHHYKSWHHLAPEKAHIVTDACGLTCIFQRFQFADGWIISNGYTVSEYPQGVNFDVKQMEGTFDDGQATHGKEDVSLSYSFGPLRKNLARTGRKRSWSLLDARSDGGGRVTQVYVKKKDDDRWQVANAPKPQRDSVIVLIWEP